MEQVEGFGFKFEAEWPVEPSAAVAHSLVFYLDQEPQRYVSFSPEEDNENFIRSLNPKFFEYQAAVHEAAWRDATEQTERHFAAVSLRNAYIHCLETLIALTFASIQAPHCVIGWMLSYQPRHLRSLVSKVRTSKNVKSFMNISNPSWDDIVKVIHANFIMGSDVNESESIKAVLANDWSRLATEYLEETTTLEYNSFKHGIRFQAGGSHLSFGIQESYGVPAKEMVTMFSSTFGSSFYVMRKLANRKKPFTADSHHSNWAPEAAIVGLEYAAALLSNVISFLKINSGANPASLEAFHVPDRTHLEPWLNFSNLGRWSTKDHLPSDFPDATEREVSEFYERVVRTRDEN